jgi:amino acid adenylation domain-containing protein
VSAPPINLSHLSPQEKRDLLAKLLKEKSEFQQLSHAQRGMWFLNQLAPNSAAYNTGFAIRILSPADPAAIERLFQKLVDRHPSLRTSFAVRGGQPVQKIHPTLDFSLERVNACGWSETSLKEHVQQSLERPFDLEHGPPMRVTLFTRGPVDHVLLIAIHHIAFDGWSFWILLEEFQRLCEAESQDDASEPLPPLETTYTDFVNWERTMLAGPVGEQHRTYWEAQLAGDLPVLEFPFDRTRPSHQGFEGRVFPFTIGKDLAQKVKERAASEGTTAFTYFLTVFLVFLHRHSGQEDVIIGSPTTGRSRPEFSGVVGDFVNMVALRARVQDKLPFRDFLHQVRGVVLDALEHQEYPFPLLVEQFRSGRHAGHSPIFQASFVFHKAQAANRLSGLVSCHDVGTQFDCGALRLAPYPLSQQSGQFDLTLEIAETGDGMNCALKYDVALIEDASAARMVERYVNLISASIADPDHRIADLPLLTERERTQILDEWNGTARTYPQTTVSKLIEEQVARTPRATAMVFEGLTMTYAELNRKANQLARHLRSLGVAPDVLVGVCMERSFDLVLALLGILKAGGAYVPLDPDYPNERLAYMIEDSCPRVLITQTSVVSRVGSYAGHLLVLDTKWKDLSGESVDDLEEGAGPDHLAYVIYTSGSTGAPKGAMNTHRAVCNLLFWMQDEYRLTPSDRVMHKTPFSFDVSVWEFFWTLMTGARFIIAQPEGHKDPAYLIRLIQKEAVTLLQFVPSMLQIFLEAQRVAGCDSVKRVFCIGEALPYELQHRFFGILGAELHNQYGPTEAAVLVTHWACQRLGQRKFVPIGRPIANTKIYILDGVGNLVPAGVSGEIYISGVQVGRGYWRQPELTAERFLADPFAGNQESRMYKTGDVGRWLEDGTVEFLGRNDFQVKIRGGRVELGEIEAQLAECEGVQDAVVVARQDNSGEQRLVAYYTCPEISDDENEGLRTEDLRAHLHGRLPEHMVPSAYVRMKQFPLTANGKLDRKALPEPDSHAYAQQVFVEPTGHIELTMAEIWKEVLGLEKVGAADNFFELGGHSLSATRLVGRLQSAFQIDLPLRAVFLEPTITGLGKHIGYDAATATYSYHGEASRITCLAEVQPRGTRTPLFLVAGFQDPYDTFHLLSRIIPHIGADQPIYGLKPRWLEKDGEDYTSAREAAGEFIAEMRTVQDKGPYFLGGYCVGGVVALEMAMQLLQEGEEVALLAMIDAARPNLMSALVDKLRRKSERAKHMASVFWGIIRANGSRSRAVSDLVRRKLSRNGPTGSSLSRGDPGTAERKLYQSRVTYRRVMYKYRAAPYPGRIISLVCEDQYRINKEMGWKSIAQGGLVIHKVPGDHVTMWKQHGKELARLLRRSMDDSLNDHQPEVASASVDDLTGRLA